MKATLVNQGAGSSYSLTEARVGGALSRHDLSIEQLGEGTQSQVRACGGGRVVGGARSWSGGLHGWLAADPGAQPTHASIHPASCPATHTTLQMKSFLLCGEKQLHDLHSKLVLDYPNGEAAQLHK